MPWLSYIFIACALQSLLLALTLLLKKGDRPSLHVLALWLFLLALDLSTANFYAAEWFRNWPHLIGIRYGLPLFYGPLLWLYTQSLLRNQPSLITGQHQAQKSNPDALIDKIGNLLSKRPWLHALPFVLLKLYLIPFYFKSAPEKIAFIEAYFQRSENGFIIIDLIIALQGTLYCIAGGIRLHIYRNMLGQYFSHTRKVGLLWLYFMVGLNLACWLLVFVLQLTSLFWQPVWIDSWVYLILSLWVFIIAFFALNQPELFATRPGHVRYERTRLAPDRLEAIQARLVKYMEGGAYLNDELSLDQIARDLELPAHQISQAVNLISGQNLIGFVNAYRLAEARRRLGDADFENHNILRIALDCGFASKSTFNALFKKKYGQTPSAYRRSQRPKTMA